MELWAGKALTLFCPQAYSPSVAVYEEKIYGYAHVKDSGWCGDRGELLSKTAADADACAALTTGAGAQSFLLGAFFRRGYCYAGTMKVDAAQYKKWQENKANPECPIGAAPGWTSSMLYDF